MKQGEEKALAGIGPIGHDEIHIQSELDNPSYAARKSENPLSSEPHRLGCQSSTMAKK
jgi:hypothetical protein